MRELSRRPAALIFARFKYADTDEYADHTELAAEDFGDNDQTE